MPDVTTNLATLTAAGWVMTGAAAYAGAGVLDRVQAQNAAALAAAPPTFAFPYRLTVVSDSRGNYQAAGFTDPGCVGATGAAFDPTKAPTWIAAGLGDAEFVACHGLSGDTLTTGAGGTGWYNPARTNAKTMADLASRALDGVHLQFVFNDVNGGAMANVAQRDAAVATHVAQYKNLMAYLAGENKPFVFEESYAPQQAGWSSNPDLRQQALDAINAQMAAHVYQNFAPQRKGAVSLVASLLKGGDGYGNPTYYTDLLHLNQAGARLIMPTNVAAWRSLLPKRTIPVGINSALTPYNYIPRWTAATNVANSDNGTGTNTAGFWAVDPVSGDVYFETTWTPTIQNVNTNRVRIMLQASLGAAASYYTVAGGETMAGACRVYLDDGFGGAPNANNIVGRMRMFGTTPFFSDWGGIGNVGVPDFAAAQDLRLWTPRVANANNSAAITPPAGDNTGFAMYVMVEAQRINAPCRIRCYPSLRRVA